MKLTPPHRTRLGARVRQRLIQSLFGKPSEKTQPSLASHEADVRYRALFEQSNDAVFILDFEGRHLQANRRAGEMLGYSPEEIVGLSARDVVVPEEYGQTRDVIQRLLTGESIRPYERIFRHRDGHHIPTEINVEIVRDRSGNPLHIQSVVRDITERKQAEDALRQSEVRYRGAIEASLDAFYMMESVRDTDGNIVDFRITQVNDCAVSQMSLPREKLIGGLICELFPINRTGGFFERYKHVVETGEPLNEEFFIPHPHAAPGWYHHKVVKVGDGVAIVNHDITERKQNEDALRESEEKYRLIAENTTDGIAIIDGASRHITYASPTYDRLWGRAVGESINLSAEQHYASIHPDDRDRVYHLIDEAIAQKAETLLLTYRAKHKQGHYFWKEDRVRIVQTPDRSTFQAYVISSDVTGRREMEDALLNSEERLRSILENMLDCVWSIDLIHNRLMYINPAIERMTGWPAEAFFANPQLWLEITHPDDRPTPASSNGSGDNSEWTGRIIRPDGEVRWLIIRNWLVKDDQGRPVRAEGIASDITQRQLAQQREIELTLEKERRRLLETFIQNTSHEFRTPLATISSGAYLMTRTDDPERRKQKAAQIEDQVKRITRLIDNLILMARIENGNEHGMKPIDIGMLMSAVCQKAANDCHKQHQMSCDIDSSRMTVHGSYDHLVEAFQQIVHNACRYTPEHGTISVKLWSEARRVWVEVKDSGPGVDEEALVHMFDTFWRQESAHSTPGLGLGLAIARRIIERHAGKIVVTSEAGQGTTLLVTLPLAPHDAYQPAKSGPSV